MIRHGTSQARWVIAAAVLGSGIAFLDGTVVNVALPAIARDLDVGVSGLQWTLDAYLVTLTSLLLFGGSLGDVFGRKKVFIAGTIGFGVTSVLCGLAPNAATLILARGLQGIAAAFLVPGSLAIIAATFHPDDRSKAIGSWSGLAGVTSAVGPFVGGWLIDAASWRWIFFINVPLVALTVWLAASHVPETRDEDASRPDWAGAGTISIALGALTFSLIERSIVAGAIAAALFVAFVAIERRAKAPMLPFEIFRSSQFTGANLTTLVLYAALGGAFFLIVVQLQVALHYSALAAGTALLPVTLLMLAFSARAGALAQRIGPQLPMTIGPIVAGVGFLLMTDVRTGSSYAADVLPGIVVFGAGLTLTVAPLTAAVLGAVDDHHAGAGSGVNNAIARLGGLVAVAVLPAIADIDAASAGSLTEGFATAMRICAGLCALGGVIAFVTVRDKAPVRAVTHPSVHHACNDPCVGEAA